MCVCVCTFQWNNAFILGFPTLSIACVCVSLMAFHPVGATWWTFPTLSIVFSQFGHQRKPQKNSLLAGDTAPSSSCFHSNNQSPTMCLSPKHTTQIRCTSPGVSRAGPLQCHLHTFVAQWGVTICYYLLLEWNKNILLLLYEKKHAITHFSKATPWQFSRWTGIPFKNK